MRLRLSPLVARDLEEIGDFIALDSPRQALRVLRALRQKMREIARQPLLYQLRPEIGEQARLAVAGSYVILFRIYAGTVRIERVVQGSRDLIAIFDGEEV